MSSDLPNTGSASNTQHPSLPTYDSLLLVSFGGPEGPDDVLPFLENVLRGRNVPQERLVEVAEHYFLFDGVSPINAQNRALLAALIRELNAHGPLLPVYWGNRNWHPMLPDVVGQMAEDGCQRALAFVTSAFGSYSGCRQYREDLERARAEVGPEAPQIDKIRAFFNHPGFIEPMAERVRAAFDEVPAERRGAARLVFTAHSVPLWMVEAGPYVKQLREACRLVADRVGRGLWDLVYQSRSGPPSQPWLEPDVCDFLKETQRTSDVRDVVLVPVGFLSEHMEVIYDLDVEAAGVCEEIGLGYVRSGLVECHPRFVTMIRELIEERLDPAAPRLALGEMGPYPDECPRDCCRRPEG